MENKVVDNREEQRIEREANEFANEPHYDNGGKYSSSPILYLKKGYIAGATKEASRNKEDAIGFAKWIRYNCHPIHDDVYRYDGETRTTEQLYEMYINQKV